MNQTYKSLNTQVCTYICYIMGRCTYITWINRNTLTLHVVIFRFHLIKFDNMENYMSVSLMPMACLIVINSRFDSICEIYGKHRYNSEYFHYAAVRYEEFISTGPSGGKKEFRSFGCDIPIYSHRGWYVWVVYARGVIHIHKEKNCYSKNTFLFSQHNVKGKYISTNYGTVSVSVSRFVTPPVNDLTQSYIVFNIFVFSWKRWDFKHLSPLNPGHTRTQNKTWREKPKKKKLFSSLFFCELCLVGVRCYCDDVVCKDYEMLLW